MRQSEYILHVVKKVIEVLMYGICEVVSAITGDKYRKHTAPFDPELECLGRQYKYLGRG